MTKIVGVTNSCNKCPHSAYYSGGTYVCTKMAGANHIEGWCMDEIPAWCPLPDYTPSASNAGVALPPNGGPYGRGSEHG